ncbi:MAG: class I SAM-dependent methyltransferase [Spirochaetales bacterium]|nr:class I SAM-dependent methyltransferase [Spirochaetales bacterium]
MDAIETDYSQIASRYDDNKVRQKGVDTEIRRLLDNSPEGISVLDLACGTGKYLKIQSGHYRNETVQWTGSDRSEEMLDVARSKDIPARLICCSAEDPRMAGDAGFDYIRNEFAWHHFTGHTAVIRNIRRMLKPGGLFTMVNICPEYMNHYWVYHYFPGTLEIDRQRFIDTTSLYESFRREGFDLKVRVKTVVSELNYGRILEEAENRDISQLTLISDREYAQGLEKIRADGNRGTTQIHDMAFLTLSAVKKEI